MKNAIYPIAFIFFLCSFSTLSSQDEAWERIIPTPQEHDLNYVAHIPQTNRIVAVGEGCTIMFSDDGGVVWDIILNAADLPNNTEFISVGFYDENTGYAVSYDGKIIKTLDGGANWNIVFETDITYKANDQADIHIFHADTLIVVGIENLILKSVNGGNSWETLINQTGFYAKSIDFLNAETGYIVGGINVPAALKTTDKGTSWFLDSIPTPNITSYLDIYFTNDTTGFLMGTNSGHYKNTYILRTTNSGSDWDSVFTIQDHYHYARFDFKDELQGAIPICSWNYGLLYTDDGGESWVTDDHVFWSYSPCRSFIYRSEYILGVGRHGRIGKANTIPEPWQELSNDWDADIIIDVEFTSAQTAYAMHQSKTGGVLHAVLRKTTDGGHQWDRITTGLHQLPSSLSFISNNLGYILHDDLFNILLSMTTDGGESWNTIYDFGEYNLDYRDPIFLIFIDSLQGVAAFRKQVFKTQDGGYTWETILSLDYNWNKFTSLLFLSPDSIFITGQEQLLPLVIKSNDGGENFEYQYIDLERGYTEQVYFKDHSTGFLLINYVDIQNGGRIFKTEDGGNSWFETITNDTNYIFYENICLTSNDIGYAVGEGDKTNAFKTTDGGATWEPIETACSSSLKFIHFFDDWHGLVFGDKGVILETFSGGVVGLEENPFVANKSNISVFPNPAQDKITIQLEESVINDVYLELYNLQGKCLVRKYFPNVSFKQNISLDISKLSPGLYTCRVKNGRSLSTLKVVKL